MGKVGRALRMYVSRGPSNRCTSAPTSQKNEFLGLRKAYALEETKSSTRQRGARVTAGVKGTRLDACITKQRARVHRSSSFGRCSCDDLGPARSITGHRETCAHPSNHTAEASRVQIRAQDSSHRSSNGDWLAEELVKQHARKEQRMQQGCPRGWTMSQEFSFFLAVIPPTIK